MYSSESRYWPPTRNCSQIHKMLWMLGSTCTPLNGMLTRMGSICTTLMFPIKLSARFCKIQRSTRTTINFAKSARKVK